MNNRLETTIDKVILKCKETHDLIAHSPKSYHHVGIGADGCATSYIDQELERIILEILEQSNLGGTILSEEAGKIELTGSEKGLMYVIDPLDGTNNAKLGFPYYALSIAILIDGKCMYSYLFEYATNNLYSAKKSHGAFFNDKKIQVSDLIELKDSHILLARPFNKHETKLANSLMLNSKRTRITGCPSLDVAMVAKGSFEGYIDIHPDKPCLKTHDILASELILTEAGGVLCDENGDAITLELNTSDCYNIIASNSNETIEKILKLKN